MPATHGNTANIKSNYSKPLEFMFLAFVDYTYMGEKLQVHWNQSTLQFFPNGLKDIHYEKQQLIAISFKYKNIRMKSSVIKWTIHKG